VTPSRASHSKEPVSASRRDGVRATALTILSSIGDSRTSLPERLAAADAVLDPRDRRFLRELVLGTLRRRGTLDYQLTPLLDRPLSRLAPLALHVIRLGAYQLLETRVPRHAAVAESVDLARTREPRLAGFVNAVLRRLAREGPRAFPDPERQPLEWLTSAGSLPPWLAQRWLAGLGASVAIARAKTFLDAPAPTFRLNPRVADAREQLLAAGIEVTPLTVPGALQSRDRGLWELAASGVAYIQDQGSQLAAHLAARSGLHLDACAAPGGKATLMADLLGKVGLVVAAERSGARLATLARLIRTWGSPNVRCLGADLAQPPFRRVFAVVLLDAPCSGLGTLGRNPDIRWRLRAQDIARNAERQIALLRSAVDLVLPGGLLVYSVCSLEPEETTQPLMALQAAVPGLLPEALPGWAQPFADGNTARLLPERDGGDGFFVAALRRLGG
jgi:16S rRNA (cytosine967-C5)-methyltransferase